MLLKAMSFLVTTTQSFQSKSKANLVNAKSSFSRKSSRALNASTVTARDTPRRSAGISTPNYVQLRVKLPLPTQCRVISFSGAQWACRWSVFPVPGGHADRLCFRRPVSKPMVCLLPAPGGQADGYSVSSSRRAS